MSAPPPLLPGSRPGIGHHLRAAFTEDLGLKAIALGLAVLLWLVVSARTPTEGYVRVRIEPVLDSANALLGETPPVRALVSGRTADLVKLYAEPVVVRRTIPREVRDTLTLDLVPSDVHIPPELRNDVHVLEIEPRRVLLRFGRVHPGVRR